MKRIQIISVSFVQHDGQPDQVHGAAQPLSAKLGKIKENSDPGPSQKQELKTRQTLTKLHGQSSNWRLKTKAPKKLGQITNPKQNENKSHAPSHL